MKLIRGIAAVSALLFAAPGISHAKDINPWTDCGIGAIIFSEYPVAAAISNIIWDLGTTAVTSMAASKDTCKGKNVTAALFIQDSYAQLEEETVKGDGQHVRAVLDIMGCNKAAHQEIVGAIRADFSTAVRDGNYAGKSALTKAQDYYNIVNTKVTDQYASQCQAV